MSRPRQRSREPMLVVTVGLEGAADVRLEACTREDEIRLREWLRRTGALRHLEAVVALLLDDLDRREAA